MRDLSDCLLRTPSVQLLCSTVPVRDAAVHISKHNRVMCLIEEAHLLRKLPVESLDLFLPALSRSNVVTCFKDRNRPILFVTSQRPSARHEKPQAAGVFLLEFALPAVVFQKLSQNLFNRLRVIR